MKPNVNEPHMAPTDVIAAIQDICSFDNGPVTSGVFGDESCAIAGDIHPRIVPKEEVTFIKIDCHKIVIGRLKVYQVFSNRVQAL